MKNKVNTTRFGSWVGVRVSTALARGVRRAARRQDQMTSEFVRRALWAAVQETETRDSRRTLDKAVVSMLPDGGCSEGAAQHGEVERHHDAHQVATDSAD